MNKLLLLLFIPIIYNFVKPTIDNTCLWCNGYNKGFKEAYCDTITGCDTTINCTLLEVENIHTDNYFEGEMRGYKDGYEYRIKIK